MTDANEAMQVLLGRFARAGSGIGHGGAGTPAASSPNAKGAPRRWRVQREFKASSSWNDKAGLHDKMITSRLTEKRP
jgi:hypothetical protein